MKFICASCQRDGMIDAKRVRVGQVVRVRCQFCTHLHRVRVLTDDQLMLENETEQSSLDAMHEEWTRVVSVDELNALKKLSKQDIQSKSKDRESTPRDVSVAWYVGVQKNVEGPFLYEVIVEKLQQGFLSPDAYVWSKGMPTWVRLHEHVIFKIHAEKMRVPVLAGTKQCSVPLYDNKNERQDAILSAQELSLERRARFWLFVRVVLACAFVGLIFWLVL